jgi:hypothetical protein
MLRPGLPERLRHLDVFVVPYKPIVGLITPMGEGEATWPATSVSLISGERDDKMMVLHGDLGNPYTLWTAAQGVFEQGQGAAS